MLLTVFLNSKHFILGSTTLYFNISAVTAYELSRNIPFFVKHCDPQREVWTNSVSMAWKLVRNADSFTPKHCMRSSDAVESRNMCLTNPPGGSNAHENLRMINSKDNLIDSWIDIAINGSYHKAKGANTEMKKC